MTINRFICELCGAQLLRCDDSNKKKFPVVRRFHQNDEAKKLLTVRCAECNEIPYRLEEGSPSRAYRFNADNVHIIMNFTREYNYWSAGIGHLFELYTSDIDEESLSYFRETPFEIGFLVEEDTNLIILAHRFKPRKWNVIPYQWHAYRKFTQDVPAADPVNENDRQFTIAVINDAGGKYLVIREEILPLEFARIFHAAIRKQIQEGVPTDIEKYNDRVKNLGELLMENKVDSLLRAKATLKKDDKFNGKMLVGF